MQFARDTWVGLFSKLQTGLEPERAKINYVGSANAFCSVAFIRILYACRGSKVPSIVRILVEMLTTKPSNCRLSSSNISLWLHLIRLQSVWFPVLSILEVKLPHISSHTSLPTLSGSADSSSVTEQHNILVLI